MDDPHYLKNAPLSTLESGAHCLFGCFFSFEQEAAEQDDVHHREEDDEDDLDEEFEDIFG